MRDADRAPLRTVRRRDDVLHALDGTPRRTADIVAALDLSRSTVERALDELASLGFVERRDGGYVRTQAGDLAVTESDRYESRLSTLTAARAVIEALPHDAEIPPEVLADSRVVESEPHSPNLPVRSLCNLVDSASSVRAFAPAVVAAQVDCYRRNVVEGDTTARLVLTDPVVERLVTDFREELSEGLGTGRLDVRRAGAKTLPYSLVVAERSEDSAMGLLVYTDTGVRGFVGNDDSAAVEWARDRLGACWAAATPLNRDG